MTKKATCERRAIVNPDGTMDIKGECITRTECLDEVYWYVVGNRGDRSARLRAARAAGYRVVKVRVTEI